jgi:threonine dehydratase
VAVESALEPAKNLSLRLKNTVLLKREDQQPVFSFKLRGAYNKMAHLSAAQLKKGVICASAGNHAQGVALSANKLGTRAVIVMPVTTPQVKIDAVRSRGAEVVLHGDSYSDAYGHALALQQRDSLTFVHPFDDPDVILGQSSVGVEILDQLGQSPDLVILPVGGGGLSSGVTRYMRDASPTTDYRFVEPLGGASLMAALKSGAPSKLPRVNSFVDGAAVARLGDITYQHLNWIDTTQVLLAPEDRICVTMLEMLNVEGIVLEPAGALSVDVLPELADEIRGKTVVCVTSGGNFDFERLPEVKERAQRYSGVKKYFILRMPQRPGALREFLEMLGPDDDIARFEYLKKSARNFGSVLIGIETSRSENFRSLATQLDAAGFTYRDITNDEILAEFLI